MKSDTLYFFLKSIFILLLTLSSALCGDTLSDLKWLLGDWQFKTKDRITIESWSSISDSTIEGYGKTHRLDNNAVSSYESLRIVSMRGDIFYLAKVAHNEFPISFKLKEVSDSLAVFENPNHDFPKKIAYHLKEDNILIVKVSNAERDFSLKFRRKKVEHER